MTLHKITFLLAVAASVACLSGCDYLPTQENKVKSEVKKKLLDPDSAKFSQIFMVEKSKNNTTTYCGFVNGRNRVGGYAGDAPFIATAYGEHYDIKIIKEPPTESDFRIYHHSRATENFMELAEKCEGTIEFEKTCGVKITEKINELCGFMNDGKKLSDALYKKFQ